MGLIKVMMEPMMAGLRVVLRTALLFVGTFGSAGPSTLEMAEEADQDNERDRNPEYQEQYRAHSILLRLYSNWQNVATAATC